MMQTGLIQFYITSTITANDLTTQWVQALAAIFLNSYSAYNLTSAHKELKLGKI